MPALPADRIMHHGALRVLKTRDGWRVARMDLDGYLQVGDLVDETVYEYFLNILPPAYWSGSILQIGEPVTHGDDGRPMFATLRRMADNVWMYTGNHRRGQTNWELVPNEV